MDVNIEGTLWIRTPHLPENSRLIQTHVHLSSHKIKNDKKNERKSKRKSKRKKGFSQISSLCKKLSIKVNTKKRKKKQNVTMTKLAEETAAVTNMESGQPELSSETSSSNLAVSDDPFAPREGKTLLWRDVNMVLVRNMH